MDSPVVVIGGGPAGLTAAYQLTTHFVPTVLLEKSSMVGGIARTEQYRGYRFDLGGHRFFTKSPFVQRMWRDILGDDFQTRRRLSRIYYRGKFFDYPLKPLNALRGLGPWESLRILASYLRWRLLPHRNVETFEQWVTNRFGKRLFQIFFKSYTEKVWGIPCSELNAEWAAQRIKDLSLRTALTSMFFKPKAKIRTLIEEFHYPRFGPGMMWETVRDRMVEQGGQVRLNCPVVAIRRRGNLIEHVVVSHEDGSKEEVSGRAFISSMPITTFVERLDPPAPPAVQNAARKLKYRDFLTVCLIVKQQSPFTDNWIYVHEPQVKVGRIQSYGNWSRDMLADPAKTSLGLEYFCKQGDDLWTMNDDSLIELAKRELAEIGLVERKDVEDGCVFRVPKSYPVYDSSYRKHLDIVRQFVDGLENFQTVGRNGLHRYNNQDHAMLTGTFAVRNLLFGEHRDLWNVNADETYHEIDDEGDREYDDSLTERPCEGCRTLPTSVDGLAK